MTMTAEISDVQFAINPIYPIQPYTHILKQNTITTVNQLEEVEEDQKKTQAMYLIV